MNSKISNWISGILVVGLLGGAIVMGFLEQDGDVASGAVAPEFTLEKYGGGTVASADLKGKVVMLDFWATWCPPCREEMPYLVNIAKEYDAKGVVFVAVSRDEPETAQNDVKNYLEYEEGKLAPYVVFSDAKIGMQYRVRALPTMVIIGKDGKIRASRTGQVSPRQIKKWLDEALAAQ